MNYHPPGPTGPVPCYRADPEPAPELPAAVLVLQEIFGVNTYVRGVVDQLAAAGMVAVAPDLFHHHAPGFQAGYDPAGIAAGRDQIAALDLPGFHAEAAALLAALRADPATNGRVGVLGFCFGGLLAWECHSLHPFDAGVSFYGRVHSPSLDGVAPLERTPGMRGPMLAHFASNDASIPATAVGACAAALVAAPARGTIEVWPRVQHGFHCWERSAYDPQAASLAWAETLAFLRAHLAA
jgi:carboxymethylenebutenolidase